MEGGMSANREKAAWLFGFSIGMGIATLAFVILAILEAIP